VAVVQYTFTHKQYTEYRERNIHNNKKIIIIWEVRAVPRLCELYPGICLTTEEKARKTLSTNVHMYSYVPPSLTLKVLHPVHIVYFLATVYPTQPSPTVLSKGGTLRSLRGTKRMIIHNTDSRSRHFSG
jgi:hypothetical protein